MTLRDLMGPGAPEVEISGLAYSSQSVTPGALFFCVPGLRSDGHDFAPDAVERVAAALVTERRLDLGVPELIVDDVRAAMGPAAARFYGDPTATLELVGITGTNGKTTTAFLVRHLLELGRVGGIRFACRVFTNLTQDHLDFHPSMEAYFAAKQRLFDGPGASV